VGCSSSSIAADSIKADLSLGRIAKPDAAVSSAGDDEARALAHFAAARELEEEGRLRGALQHYREAVKASPHDIALTQRTAELALTFEGRDAAIGLLNDNIKANPTSSAAIINLARFLVTYPDEAGKSAQQVNKVLTEALTKFPGSPEVYREAVMLHLTRNLRDDAMKVMELAAKQTVADPVFWLETGRIAQEVWPLSHPDKRDEHRKQVNPFFEKALKLAPPARSDVHMAVAQYYLLSNQLDRASEITESLAKLTNNLDAKRLLVRLRQAAGREDDAITLLEDIVKEAPNEVETRRQLATIYERKEDFAKAVPHAEAMIQTAGGSADDYAAVSYVFMRANEVEKMRKLCLRGMGLFPNDARFPHLCAVACRVEKRLNDAIGFYAKAETLAQSSNATMLDDRFYSTWADTLQAAEKFDDAARTYQRAIDLVPQSEPTRAATILNNLGYMWLEQNRNIDQAGVFIKKATELDPKNPVYLDSLGWFHFLKGHHKESLQLLLEVEKLIAKPDAGDAEIFDHIAQAYLKLGDKARAIDYLKRATELNPADAKIHQRLQDASR
jgi:tetratricopeptide (TPR) repeat protein